MDNNNSPVPNVIIYECPRCYGEGTHWTKEPKTLIMANSLVRLNTTTCQYCKGRGRLTDETAAYRLAFEQLMQVRDKLERRMLTGGAQ